MSQQCSGQSAGLAAEPVTVLPVDLLGAGIQLVVERPDVDTGNRAWVLQE